MILRDHLPTASGEPLRHTLARETHYPPEPASLVSYARYQRDVQTIARMSGGYWFVVGALVGAAAALVVVWL